jgi:hypothetical protein
MRIRAKRRSLRLESVGEPVGTESVLKFAILYDAVRSRISIIRARCFATIGEGSSQRTTTV